ncbi:MAG TPA: hypothetical protein VHZ09_01920 [Acidobacteriaceae bacterium]|jgi:hypothetical protein|nr:hypothetical protein [Acidobacteriaceae bacterium]
MKLTGFAASSQTTPPAPNAVANCGVMAVALLCALAVPAGAQSAPQFEINAPNDVSFRLTPDPADGREMFFVFLEDGKGNIDINAPIGKANIATHAVMPNGPDFNANEKLLEEARAAAATMHMYGGAQGVPSPPPPPTPINAPGAGIAPGTNVPASVKRYWDAQNPGTAIVANVSQDGSTVSVTLGGSNIITGPVTFSNEGNDFVVKGINNDGQSATCKGHWVGDSTGEVASNAAKDFFRGWRGQYVRNENLYLSNTLAVDCNGIKYAFGLKGESKGMSVYAQPIGNVPTYDKLFAQMGVAADAAGRKYGKELPYEGILAKASQPQP